jgi:GNAT superfamily N-acetyltransferase
VIIRHYKETDTDEARRLCEEFVEMIDALLPPEQAKFEANVDGGLDIWITTAAKPGQAFFVAEAEPGKLVGFIQGRHEEHSEAKMKRWGVVEALFVQEKYRGQGLGSELYLTIEKWFAGQGCVAARVDTWLLNTPAVDAYRAMGFIPFYTGFVKEIAPRGGK